MADVDRILIQPGREALAEALRAAFVKANQGQPRRGRLPSWPPEDLDAVLSHLETQPEGHRLWSGQAQNVVAHAFLLLAWWTDHAGRRHCRLVGGDKAGQARRSSLDHAVGPDVPALRRLYPDQFLFHTRGGQRRSLALCACGVWGEPGQFGWMGPCCGPCHDRREAGEPPPPTTSWTFRDLSGGVSGLAFSPDGSLFAVRGHGTVRLWDLRTGGQRAALGTAKESSRQPLAFSPDGELLAWCCSRRPEVQVWNHRTMQHRRIPGRALAFSPDRQELLVTPAARNGELTRFDARTGQALGTLPGTRGLVCSQLASAPDGRTLLAVCARTQPSIQGNAALLLDARTGVVRGEFDLNYREVGLLAYSPAGVPLAVLRGRLPGELWDLAAPRQLATLAGWGNYTHGFALSPDGRTLAADGDRAICAWDGANGVERATLEWHTRHGGLVAFSPDGRLLASGGPDAVRVGPAELLGGS